MTLSTLNTVVLTLYVDDEISWGCANQFGIAIVEFGFQDIGIAAILDNSEFWWRPYIFAYSMQVGTFWQNSKLIFQVCVKLLPISELQDGGGRYLGFSNMHFRPKYHVCMKGAINCYQAVDEEIYRYSV
jgi:hypothetical protein